MSGLVASGGRLFAEEDSGAAPVVLQLGPRGTLLARTTVTGATAVDWEDIAADGAALFLGDIGDNDAVRPSVQIWRVARPAPGAVATEPAVRLERRYPDGPHDAEALLADPLRHELVVVTKGLLSARAYTTSETAPDAVLRKGPRLDLGLVTAGDVSADGRIVALRTYDELAVWRRRGREPLRRTLARPPCLSPTGLAGEGQGEALALDARGRSFRTVPEGADPPLRRYVPRP